MGRIHSQGNLFCGINYIKRKGVHQFSHTTGCGSKPKLKPFKTFLGDLITWRKLYFTTTTQILFGDFKTQILQNSCKEKTIEDAQTQFELGLRFKHGDGVSKNEEKALELIQNAANQGLASAQYELGSYFWEDITISGNPNWVTSARDFALAIHWLEKSAAQGYSRALKSLGKHPDLTPELLCRYGDNYCFGSVVFTPENDQKAAFWYEKSAERGYARAQHMLGAMLLLPGHSIPQNFEKAMYWLQKAMNQGFHSAEFLIGSCFEQGSGGQSQDYAKAAYHFQRAAENGLKPAQLSMAIFLLEGKGVDKDPKKAVFWLEKAAQRDPHKIYYMDLIKRSNSTPTAQYLLGYCLLKGIGVEKNRIRALNLIREGRSSLEPKYLDTLKKISDISLEPWLLRQIWIWIFGL